MESDKINKTMIRNEFNQKITRLTRSSAYLDFCEEVYGYRMYLFNMMDKQQLDFIINTIPISPVDMLLDLGCGAGSVLNILITKYGCKGIGIDQLNNETVERNSKEITYINADIDKLSQYDLKPSITLAIDSLYFSSDLDMLVNQLKNIKNNRLYLFYSQYIFDQYIEDRSVLDCDKTRLALTFEKNQISYKTVDYSENEFSLYENSLRVLPKYKNAFECEGNSDLYEAKLREDTCGREMYNKGLASRYLYIIE
ncbi:MAG: class I SAM-dependent methyltransferase [Bacillota bacterium]